MYNAKVWTGFNCLRKVFNGRILFNTIIDLRVPDKQGITELGFYDLFKED
jgi:hypothetical protein